jgi:L-ascorbate metabolism protein UlaG (beta-lactamase superfamily)
MKRIIFLMSVFLACLVWGQTAAAQDVSPSSNTGTLLKTPLLQKDAVIWFTGQDGFVVKTKRHLLVFDYNRGDRGASAGFSLASGFVNPQEIKDLNVVVFVTHCDGDHYNRSVWEWKETVKRITYVLGFEPQMPLEKYIHIQPWQEKRIGDVQVAVVPSIDSGEAYLVKVDELSIYHAGDLGYVIPEAQGLMVKALDFLAPKGRPVDLLFMNGEPYSNPARGFFHPNLDEGIYMALEKLAPNAVFPMHGAVEETIPRILKAAPSDKVRSEFGPKMFLANRLGGVFIYRNGKIVDR